MAHDISGILTKSASERAFARLILFLLSYHQFYRQISRIFDLVVKLHEIFTFKQLGSSSFFHKCNLIDFNGSLFYFMVLNGNGFTAKITEIGF